MKYKHLVRGSLLVLWSTFSLSLGAQVVVIVSAKNPVSKMTPEQVAQIFLGQAGTFITGGKAEPLDLGEKEASRADFYTKVVGKSPAQVKAHWSKQAFSGKGQPPKSLESVADMVKTVAENPKYIGYVDKSAVNPGVKVLVVQ